VVEAGRFGASEIEGFGAVRMDGDMQVGEGATESEVSSGLLIDSHIQQGLVRLCAAQNNPT
jgi:hypothetical protein